MSNTSPRRSGPHISCQLQIYRLITGYKIKKSYNRQHLTGKRLCHPSHCYMAVPTATCDKYISHIEICIHTYNQEFGQFLGTN